MTGEIRIKRGETPRLEFQFVRDGQPADVGHVTLSAQVRTPAGRLVATLSLAKQPVLGLVTSTLSNTANWPEGRLSCDLRTVVSGVTHYSKTFAIFVSREVTQA